MKYLITGHTGFKGSWLTALLTAAGHEVSGLSLDPEPGSLFDRADISKMLSHDRRGDIRDAVWVQSVITEAQPSFVIHFAAQPLVRLSYLNPVETVQVNTTGTMNVLEAIKHSDSVEASLIVTTDKVYRNDGRRVGYRESDPLGGRDPYSASKAMADILASSWAASFELPPTVIARAGNVIGGGDSAQDRLFPDLIRAWSRGKVAEIRNGDAVRPWQHVLDCLNGYMRALKAAVATGDANVFNFGPLPEQVHPVRELVHEAASCWGTSARWEPVPSSGPHEESMLLLDSSKARVALKWSDLLTFKEAIRWTVAWEKQVLQGSNPQAAVEEQLDNFAQTI